MPIKKPGISLSKDPSLQQLKFECKSPQSLIASSSPLCVEKRKINLLSTCEKKTKTKARSRGKKTKKDKGTSRKRKRVPEESKSSKKRRKDRESKLRNQVTMKRNKFVENYINMEDEIEEMKTQLEEVNEELEKQIKGGIEKKQRLQSLQETIHSYNTTMEKLKESQRKQVEDVKEQQRKQVEDAREEQRLRLAIAHEEHQKNLKACTEEYQKKVETSKEQHRKEIERNQEEHRKELERKREIYEQNIRSSESKHAAQITSLEQRLAQEVPEARRLAEENARRTESRLEKELSTTLQEKKRFENEYRTLQKKEWELQEKIKQLSKENSDLEKSNVELQSKYSTEVTVLKSSNEKLEEDMKKKQQRLEESRMSEQALKEKLKAMEIVRDDLRSSKELEVRLRDELATEKAEAARLQYELKTDLAVTKNKLEGYESQSKKTNVLNDQHVDDLRKNLAKQETRANLLETKLAETEEKTKKLEIENERLQQQLKFSIQEKSDLSAVKEKLEHNLSQIQNQTSQQQIELQRSKQDMEEMRSMKKRLHEQQQQLKKLNDERLGEVNSIHGENIGLRTRVAVLDKENEELKIEVKELREKQHQDYKIRRELHNKIIELKGNIRVFCRVRPFIGQEEQKGVFKFPTEEKIEVNVDGAHSFYEFDRIFQPTDTQEDVFLEVQEVVQSALDGYNVCVFAYGQTSSGKTFTMEGANLVDHRRGLIPRAVEKIFEEIADLKLRGWEYEIKLSILEVYNEEIFDLLSTSNERLKLRFGGNGSKKEVEVVDLKHVPVRTPQDVHPILKSANRKRSTGATQSNAKSSRSHSVFTLYLKGHNSETKHTTQSRLCLVDLAGSERLKQSQAEGDRLRETQSINKSLHHLKTVIKEIGTKNRHIGYRNSKLTSVLRPSLGGQAKVLMILNLCPGKDLVQESLLSLRFGSEASRVEVGRAKKNVKKT